MNKEYYFPFKFCPVLCSTTRCFFEYFLWLFYLVNLEQWVESSAADWPACYPWRWWRGLPSPPDYTNSNETLPHHRASTSLPRRDGATCKPKNAGKMSDLAIGSPCSTTSPSYVASSSSGHGLQSWLGGSYGSKRWAWWGPWTDWCCHQWNPILRPPSLSYL